jgi:hypothetical protein
VNIRCSLLHFLPWTQTWTRAGTCRPKNSSRKKLQPTRRRDSNEWCQRCKDQANGTLKQLTMTLIHKPPEESKNVQCLSNKGNQVVESTAKVRKRGGLENAAINFCGVWHVEKAAIRCVSTCIHFAKASSTHLDRILLKPAVWTVKPTKIWKCGGWHWRSLAHQKRLFSMCKYIHSSWTMVEYSQRWIPPSPGTCMNPIFVLQNFQVLTEIEYPSSWYFVSSLECIDTSNILGQPTHDNWQEALKKPDTWEICKSSTI